MKINTLPVDYIEKLSFLTPGQRELLLFTGLTTVPAVGGALLDKEKPLRGAMIGGMGGAAGHVATFLRPGAIEAMTPESQKIMAAVQAVTGALSGGFLGSKTYEAIEGVIRQNAPETNTKIAADLSSERWDLGIDSYQHGSLYEKDKPLPPHLLNPNAKDIYGNPTPSAIKAQEYRKANPAAPLPPTAGGPMPESATPPAPVKPADKGDWTDWLSKNWGWVLAAGLGLPLITGMARNWMGGGGGGWGGGWGRPPMYAQASPLESPYLYGYQPSSFAASQGVGRA
jgi:hypothetical protein